ncbi:DUF262 domain-containing protein [bacterium]|nr:DUF262 domain-containing protein [bacterium]
MAKQDINVEELVRMIEKGELRLPEMQRRYVWRSTRVRDLLDSLYRGYPSGAILVWDTDENVPQQEFAVKQQANPYRNTKLLLDGQQRLTSLSAVIRGEPIKVRSKGKTRDIEILFNLEHPEKVEVVTEVDEGNNADLSANDNDSEAADESEDEAVDSTEDELQKRLEAMTFVVGTKKLEKLPNWVKVSEVFQSHGDAAFLKRAGVKDLDDPKAVKYSERLRKLRAIKNYQYRMDILEKKLSYDEVTEIFVRVNSLGVKLRSSDLALAQITAKWRGSLADFEEEQARFSKNGFEVELGVLLRNLVIFATGQCKFITIGKIEIEKLKEAWRKSVHGMEYAINFIKSSAGIDSPALLSSLNLLLVIGYYGHLRSYKLQSKEANELLYWAILANAKGRYSRGSSETLLDQDLAILKDGKGPVELLEKLRLQVGRLDIGPEEFEGRNQRSAIFKTMFLAFRKAGAKDWNSKLPIGKEHIGANHSLQYHHIFPKAYLKREAKDVDADDIANLAFIAGRTNRAISDKSPATYLPLILKESGEDILIKQCIPTDPTLLEASSYESFLRARRNLMATRINTFFDECRI